MADRGLRFALIGTVLCMLLFLTSKAAFAENDTALRRVASASLCADQYILALADRRQIVSLTWQSQGPLSAYADRAVGIPINHGAAEEFIASKIDVVVVDEWGSTELRRVLARFDIAFVELPLVDDFATIEATVVEVARALGQDARGEAVIADMRSRLARVDRLNAEVPFAPLAVYFRPDGGGAGVGTYVDTAMARAGFVNVARRYGMTGWGRVPLEQLVLDPPDAIVTSFFDTSHDSLARRFGSHALYQQFSRDAHVIAVPAKLWPCSAPMLAEATELMARARVERFRAEQNGQGQADPNQRGVGKNGAGR
ncbi:MAG: ABC transporter substrate-binding protein [Pseudomonadota bacterium]